MKVIDIINKAVTEVGVTENPPNSNDVKYNKWYYGKSVSGPAYPWCCAFISWLFRDTDLVKRTSSCVDMLAWFEKKKQIVKTPEPGDIVFFKYGTNSRRTNHIGLVIGVEGKRIHTVEGNTSLTSNDNGGAVMKRVRTSNIVAYARPNYEDKRMEYPVIKEGSKGDYVIILQTKLNNKGYKLDIDGQFGSNTKQAVISFQGEHNLIKDGIVGKNTWNKLGV